MRPCQPTRRDRAIALLLFVVSATALGLAQRNLGVVRDEGPYFDAAKTHWRWFAELGDNIAAGRTAESFKAPSIRRHWAPEHMHPVLLKTFFALSWRLLSKPTRGETTVGGGEPIWPVLDEISALRLPTWLVAAFGVTLIYLLGIRIGGRLVGLSAALLYLTMPRPFFHGQLSCFDASVTTMWLLVVYAYFRALDRPPWAVIAGLCFGLALATKHNAWFLPPLLVVHYLIVIRPDISLRPLRLRVPLVFIAMAILGPLVFYAHWPWIWYDTVKWVTWYFKFHLHHDFYSMAYLGRYYHAPPLPISYPFGMTLFTAPTVMLLLGLGGLWVYARAPLLSHLSRWVAVRLPAEDNPWRFPARRSWLCPAKGLDPHVGTLLVINAFFPLVLIALPWTPIFGGTKHFMPGYPFIALLAGVGLQRLIDGLRRHRPRLASPAALALPLLVALPGAVNIALTHPFGLSQYNALAGGPAGGADLGLNRQFWGYAPRQLLPWLNDKLPDHTSVYFHDISYGAYRAYIRAGLLRPDLRFSGGDLQGIRASRAALVMHELHFNKYDYWIWDSYGHPAPTRVLDLDGVPLVSVYLRQRNANR